MPLKLVLIDFSNTLASPSGKMAPLMPEAIARCREHGLKVAIVTNGRRTQTLAALQKADIEVDLVLGSDTVGAKKPSPAFCEKAIVHFGVKPHECVYLGDDDKTDALCAVNAGVLYLAAHWANPAAQYGIPCGTPDSFIRFVFRFLVQPPFWYQHIEAKDRRGRMVAVRGLYFTTRTSTLLKDVLKYGYDPKVGDVKGRGFLFRRLLSSLYGTGLIGDIDYWTWYPSHDGNPIRPKHAEFLLQTSRLFRDRYLPDLLHRHKAAAKAAFARARGEDPGFLNQVNSVHVNPLYRERIQRKRVLVVDDFSTKGYSFECARNLLLHAGAGSVLGVCFARYHSDYVIQSPRKGLSFDPWTPCNFAVGDFTEAAVVGTLATGMTDDVQRLATLDISPLGG